MSKVRVGIIGLGSWGECHLQAFHSLPQVEIAAVCDIREERLNSLADRFGINSRYTAEQELLQRADLDLISVATFEKNHLGSVLQALASGKHVIVEKPVSTKLEEAQRMIEQAELSGRDIMPGHLLRFDPQYSAIYKGIQNGEIGKPISMYFRRSRQKSLFQMYQRTHTVYELTVHDLDLAIWYAGSRIKSVRAYGRTASGAPVPEVLWSCLQFENGAIAVLNSNWMTPDEAGIAINDAVELIGEKGSASFETSNSGLQIWNQRGRSTPDFNIHHVWNESAFGALKEQFSYICNCILTERKPEYISFADAVHGIEVADAIVRSCETGQDVHI